MAYSSSNPLLSSVSSSVTSTRKRPWLSLQLAVPDVEKTLDSEMALVARRITMEQFVEAIDQQQLHTDRHLDLDLDAGAEEEEEDEEEEEEEEAKEKEKEVKYLESWRIPEAAKSGLLVRRRSVDEMGIWSRIEKATGSEVPRDRRFATISRFLLIALWWQRFGPLAMEERRREDGETLDELQGLIEVEEAAEDGDSMIFDPSIFKTKWATNKDLLRGVLDKRILDALRRQEWQRTTKELNDIEKYVVSHLGFFSSYPERVRVEVGRVMSLEVVTRGRVIVRQGDPASGFYCLVKGSAIVLLAAPDHEGRQKSRIIGEMEAGSCFGATSLLNDIRRGTTVVSKGTSEILRVDKDDFRFILASKFQEEIQNCLTFMSRLPQFAGVETETLQLCCQHASVLTFGMDKVVSPPSGNDDRLIRFIATGSCDVIRRNLCRPWSSPDQSRKPRVPVTCPDAWELGGRQPTRKTFTGDIIRSEDLAPPGKRARYLHVGVLDTGAYFGVGEDLSDYLIISKTHHLRLLLLPRSIFLHHFGPHRLRRLRQELEQAIPSVPEVCRLYRIDIRWNKYKQEVVKQTLEHVTRFSCARRRPRTSNEGDRVRSRVRTTPSVVIG